MKHKIPVILIDENTYPAFSLFNPNEWGGESKPIILSCAANYGLLIYSLTRVNDIFERADVLCLPRGNNLKAQWETARWDLSECMYLVDIPEAHLSIHSFLTTVKTLLDVFVQLISSEGIVSKKIHGFHKKGNNIGGKLLHILKHKASITKRQSALRLHELICQHKETWIDQAVNSRDLFIHPEKGLTRVMFGLSLCEHNGKLNIDKIVKPTIDDQDFDIYAEKTLLKVEQFLKKSIEYIKST